MAAASPVYRWLCVAGLLAGAGCQSSGSSPSSSARAQAPLDFLAPLSPTSSQPTNLSAAQPLPALGPTTPLQAASTTVPVAPTGPVAPGAHASDVVDVVQGYPVTVPPVQGFPIASSAVSPASFVAANHDRSHGGQQDINEILKDLPKDATGHVKLVALVGLNNPITVQEVQEGVQQDWKEIAAAPPALQKAKEKEKYREVLRTLIERELILDDMFTRLKKSKVNIDDIKEEAGKMADDQIRSMRKSSGIRTEEEFIAVLRAQGMTLAGFRRQIERRMMAEQYISSLFKETGKTRTPGFAEVHSYYENHADEFQVQDRVRWQDLFISVNRFNRPEEALAHAQELRQQLLQGSDFISLIKAEEHSPIGRQSWDGIGTTHQDVPPDVAPAVWSLQPGQFSDIIKTNTGFHIVKVVEREYAGVRPLDWRLQTTIVDKIKRQNRDQEYKKVVQELWRNAMIKVYPNPMLDDEAQKP